MKKTKTKTKTKKVKKIRSEIMLEKVSNNS